MSARKTERLFNLVICLLATRRYLSAEQIRAAVPGYPDGTEAFKRMFERDKEELRELGIPLETGSSSAVFDDEPGYRIRREAYALPAISLEPEEAAVLGLAARAWHQASIAATASNALLKLRAAGVQPEDVTLAGIEPRVTAREPAFPPLWDAVLRRYPVSFDYLAAGATHPASRRVAPWGVVSWRGRWYLVGHDHDRAGERVFRLDRITGPVRAIGADSSVVPPDDVDLPAVVRRLAEPAVTGTATLRLRRGAAYELRRLAERERPGDDGWDVVEIGYSDVERLADTVVGFGAAVVVVDPPELREAVLRRLRIVATATEVPA